MIIFEGDMNQVIIALQERQMKLQRQAKKDDKENPDAGLMEQAAMVGNLVKAFEKELTFVGAHRVEVSK